MQTMYTILMDENKKLRATKRITIYQGENSVDQIRFLIPQKYNDLNLSDFNVILKYVDQINNPDVEILVKEDELYKDRLDYRLPVNTVFTKLAGEIKFYLSFIRVNFNKGLTEEVLHTSEVTIPVLPRKDYFEYVPSKFLDIVDQKIAKMDVQMKALDSMAEAYDENKADDIDYNKEQNTLQLTAKNKPIGKKITLDSSYDEEGVPVVDFSKQIIPDSPSEVNNVVKF